MAQIRVDSAFRKHVDEKDMQRLVDLTLECAGVEEEVELGLYITNDAKMKELNRAYRGVDETTDVLSFALSESEAESFIGPPDSVLPLGEVIISFPRAAKQAEDRDRSLHEEMAWLVVHGVLHLLGYDHDKPSRERRMRTMERKAMAMASKGAR